MWLLNMGILHCQGKVNIVSIELCKFTKSLQYFQPILGGSSGNAPEVIPKNICFPGLFGIVSLVWCRHVHPPQGAKLLWPWQTWQWKSSIILTFQTCWQENHMSIEALFAGCQVNQWDMAPSAKTPKRPGHLPKGLPSRRRWSRRWKWWHQRPAAACPGRGTAWNTASVGQQPLNEVAPTQM